MCSVAGTMERLEPSLPLAIPEEGEVTKKNHSHVMETRPLGKNNAILSHLLFPTAGFLSVIVRYS